MFNREAIVIMLTKLGVDYEMAVNGQEGVEKVEEYIQKGKRFDIVLMDLIMPVLDGYQAAEAIRKLERRHGISETQRLFICGYSSHVNRGKLIKLIMFVVDCMLTIFLLDVEDKVFDSGMDDIVAKPMKMHSLDRMLKDHITN